jgi:hypothetical protein
VAVQSLGAGAPPVYGPAPSAFEPARTGNSSSREPLGRQPRLTSFRGDTNGVPGTANSTSLSKPHAERLLSTPPSYDVGRVFVWEIGCQTCRHAVWQRSTSRRGAPPYRLANAAELRKRVARFLAKINSEFISTVPIESPHGSRRGGRSALPHGAATLPDERPSACGNESGNADKAA